MRALLQKDVYVLWKQMRIFLVVMLVIMAGNGAFGGVFVVVWCAMLPYTALAYDERSRWDQLAAMMPYAPRDLVLSKYVLGWGCSAAAGAVVLALQAVVRALGLPLETASPQAVFIAFCVSACALAITLPLMFRFSVERGRMVMFLVVFLVCGGAGALASLTNPAGAENPAFAASLLRRLALLAPIAAAGLTAVSIPVSLRLYAARR